LRRAEGKCDTFKDSTEKQIVTHLWAFGGRMITQRSQAGVESFAQGILRGAEAARPAVRPMREKCLL
jgi:hypothetical protein